MDLTSRLGFRADLNLETGEIDFHEIKPALVLERRLNELAPVLSALQEGTENPVVHILYRFIGDRKKLELALLKFDITVVMPVQMGKELPKTIGHYHRPLPWPPHIPSPDFYQRVYGKGVVLLQSENGTNVAAYVVEPQEMQHVLIPQWMGHLIINTGDEPLVFGNISVRVDHTNYEPYTRRRGAAFYLREDGSGARFVPNPMYQNPSLTKLTPNDINLLERLRSKPLYPLLTEDTWPLRMLTFPHYYPDVIAQSLK